MHFPSNQPKMNTGNANASMPAIRRMTSLQTNAHEQAELTERPYHSLPDRNLATTIEAQQKNLELARRKVLALGMTTTDEKFAWFVCHVSGAQMKEAGIPNVAQMIAEETINPKSLEQVEELCKTNGILLKTRASLVNLADMLIKEKRVAPQIFPTLDISPTQNPPDQ